MGRGPYRYESESESESNSEPDEREGTIVSDSEVERERERHSRWGANGERSNAALPVPKTQVLHQHGRDVIVISSDEDEEANVEPAKRRHSGTVCPLDDEDEDDVEDLLVVPSSQPDEVEIDFYEAVPQTRRGSPVVIRRSSIPEPDPLPTAHEWSDGYDDSIIEVDIPKRPRKPVRKDLVQSTPSAGRTNASRELLSPSLTPASSPSKAASPRKKKADPVLERRMAMAEALFSELNATVFNNGITGVEIKWNARFLTTAGRAKWKMSPEGVHSSILELSPKVIDSDDRLRNTVAHEMCHLASWMLDRVPTEQHGRLWTAWTNKVMRVRPDIKITARHEYEISYKFQWKCTQCDTIFGRHTKSIDVEKQACPCSGLLVALFDSNSRSRKTAATSRLAASQPQGSPTSRRRGDTPDTIDITTAKPSRRHKPNMYDGNIDEDIAELVKALASSEL